MAVYDVETSSWFVDKGVLCAGEDARFHDLAMARRGQVLISHVRQKTVGETALSNTHPFQHGHWVFAHNGTLTDLGWLRAGTSPERAAEIAGQTDSELLFAWLRTRLDEAGIEGKFAGHDTDRVIGGAARAARDRAGIGAFNFLLSDGTTTYGHRFGRTLYLLERGPHDAVRSVRSSEIGTTIETPWSTRRRAVLVASEAMTDEPWQSVEEGMLLRVDREPVPHWRLVAA
jgi:predicted glutamine amidotransferase